MKRKSKSVQKTSPVKKTAKVKKVEAPVTREQGTKRMAVCLYCGAQHTRIQP